MAIVRLPGTVIEWSLPEERSLQREERTIFGIEVLDSEKWRWAARNINEIRTESDALNFSRRLVGIGLKWVRNLRILNADGALEEFELEKRGDELTARSASILHPYLAVLVEAIKGAQIFDVADAKNSQSPSAA